MHYDPLKCTFVDEQILILTLDRPQHRNALNTPINRVVDDHLLAQTVEAVARQIAAQATARRSPGPPFARPGAGGRPVGRTGL